MADMLSIDYGQMSDAAKRLTAEWDTMTSCIDSVTGVVDSLPDFWKADTATKYMEQYEELKPSLNDAIQLISDMAEQMTQISNNFQETDSGMAGQM